MTSKFLYTVDHFIPFPRSEYGGMWVVVAQNDDECFDLIAAEDDGLNDDYYNRLRENIIKHQHMPSQKILSPVLWSSLPPDGIISLTKEYNL